MAASKQSSVPKSLLRDVAVLKQRVAWLEKALKPQTPGRHTGDWSAQFKRTMAESNARWEALKEYWNRDRDENYRKNPDLLTGARKREKEMNAFLKERGFAPLRSQLRKRLPKDTD
jgi:flagellar biosynthesis/type III secretory pathway chaperone